jgi:eukaryotic-like serine/threonine-protein kinase
MTRWLANVCRSACQPKCRSPARFSSCSSRPSASFFGRGGMAFIYEARHTGLDKRVAVKVLCEHLAPSSLAAARFEREGRAASRIRHPNVVQIFEVGRHDGTPYLVMQLLEGTDVAGHSEARGALTSRVTHLVHY